MTVQTESGEHVYLIGRAPLKDYLNFLTTRAEDARSADTRRLAEEWRAANDRLNSLRRIEATFADNPPMVPVPDEYKPVVDRVLADPVFQRAFAALPIAFGVVELDRLVVVQNTINLAHARRLRERLGESPTPEQVFRLCLPFDHPTPPCRVRQVSNKSYVFLSDSTDLCFLESAVFTPNQVQNYPAIGPLAGMVGVVVGFGSNYLNTVFAEGRLVLNNGSHRAYALRALGVTHAPCVIQQVGRRDELSLAGPPALHSSPDSYLREPRPPVLKDYFDPRLHKRVRLPLRVKQVRVSFSVEEVSI